MNAEPSLLAFALLEKIHSRHNDHQAIVYVRQSTVRHVEHNRQSARLQYAFVDRAFRLGWRGDQITVIDDDLARSGASAVDRPRFQRLVAEVGLGHVGMVIGIEVSRLARSCRGLDCCDGPTIADRRIIEALAPARHRQGVQ
jgi:DNA invertase Pin-like site-specific DNA recombinase